MKEFSELLDTIKALRAPDGCPWDKEQTPFSMQPNLIEECYETVDAINEKNPQHAKEELGDLLFNTLMIAYMYQQSGDFTLEEVLGEVNEKIIRRHPHVFGTNGEQPKLTDSAQVSSQWEKIKTDLEGRQTDFILDQVPASFPPLLRGYKMLKKASRHNFEWDSLEETFAKVSEELDEVIQAQKEGNFSHLEEEFGDLLLAVVNYARWLGVNAEVAMNRANSKFYKRFCYIEEQMAKKNIPMTRDHRDMMLKLWIQAKTI